MLQNIEQRDQIVGIVRDRQIVRQSAWQNFKARSLSCDCACTGIVLNGVHIAECAQHAEISSAAAACFKYTDRLPARA